MHLAAALLLIFLLFGGTLVLGVYLGLFGKLPTDAELRNIKQDNASVVLSSDGRLMGKYYQVNRQSILNEAISPHVRHALVATEDNRFFDHHGIDVLSLARVFFKSLLLADRDQGGGSTISQQLAKNLFPRKDYLLFSLPVNKIREMFIASSLEDVYDKEEILTLYLNSVSFGENVYGIEAASLRFYNKPSAGLSIDESATLVGMLAANTAYNPRLHPERAKKRRNVVLSRMHTQGFIPEDVKDKLSAEPIRLDYRLMDNKSGIAPYFRHYLKAELISILGNEQLIDTGGLKIYTTIDAGIQQYAELAMKEQLIKLQDEFDRHWKGRSAWEKHPEVYEKALKGLRPYKKLEAEGKTHNEILEILSRPSPKNIYTPKGEERMQISSIDSLAHYLQLLNSGFFAMDPKSGAVLAWIGGSNFQYRPYDHVTASRQAGSTFKPFVYATALEKGFDPCYYIANDKRTYEEYDNWSPGNSGGTYGGYYSLKGGLMRSLNTITAEVMIKTGPADVAALARRAGIGSPLPVVPSLALGTADVSLMEMVSAYTAFAGYGHPVKAYYIERIEDSRGDTLYTHKEEPGVGQAFTEETAAMMVNMMQAVVDSGTARAARSLYGLHCDLAGKTGTTQNNADGWFIAFTPALVAGAWVGAESPAIHFRTTALGSGTHMALPIVARTLKKIEASADMRSSYLPPFRPVADTLAAAMDCPPYTRSLPLPYLSRENKREIRKDIREREQAEMEEKKPGFFKRIGNFFRRKKK